MKLLSEMTKADSSKGRMNEPSPSLRAIGMAAGSAAWQALRCAVRSSSVFYNLVN